jgi:beta-glucanase (GH16 family)
MNNYSKPLLALLLAQGIILAGCGGSGKPEPESKWSLVWSDEFDGETIDTTKWEHEVNCWGGGNNELQCYTGDAENSYVGEGVLHIVAKHEPGTTGPAVNQDDPAYDPNDTSATKDYTSARLRTRELADWKYGRFEINAKLPEGQGLWPAIWMLPTDYVYGGWPLSGEIDIMEAVNPNGTGGNEVHGTLHHGLAWPNNKHTGKAYTPATNVWEEFHTYAVEWEEGEIRWYVDDTHYATQTQDGWFTYYYGGQEVGFQIGEGAAPFDQQFHLLLNVAVGGNWPSGPDVNTLFPQEMVVDYVRVYECSVDPLTGQGCDENVDSAIVPLTGVPAPAQEVFMLYEDGPATLTLNAQGIEVENTLVPGYYDGGAVGNIVSDPALDVEGNIVWDLMFNASPGNAFLSTEDMSEEGVEDGFRLANMAVHGELKFDLLVTAIDPETQLLIKLDSGWPNVSQRSIDIPETGVWTSVSVPFAQFEANTIQPGDVDYDKVTNPFVIEPAGGTAHVQLDNIRITCLAECGVDVVVNTLLTTSFDVYVDGALGANWLDPGIGVYEDAGGHVLIDIVSDVDNGDVLEVSYSASTAAFGLMYFQSSVTKDVTAFESTGYLTFDIKITGGLGDYVIKADCVHPCSSGDIALDPITVGSWQTVTVDISTLVAGGLDPTKLNTPLVIFPKAGQQANATFRLDNVRWVLP